MTCVAALGGALVNLSAQVTDPTACPPGLLSIGLGLTAPGWTYAFLRTGTGQFTPGANQPIRPTRSFSHRRLQWTGASPPLVCSPVNARPTPHPRCRPVRRGHRQLHQCRDRSLPRGKVWSRRSHAGLRAELAWFGSIRCWFLAAGGARRAARQSHGAIDRGNDRRSCSDSAAWQRTSIVDRRGTLPGRARRDHRHRPRAQIIPDRITLPGSRWASCRRFWAAE